jgi:hypothetical protein
MSFLAAFSPVSNTAAARAEMKMLYQDKLVDNYIVQFRMTTARTGIREEAALIKFFLDRLEEPIVKQIFLMETFLTFLKEMYMAAAQIYQSLQWAKSILAKGRDRTRAMAKSKKERKDREVKVTISHLSVKKKRMAHKTEPLF